MFGSKSWIKNSTTSKKKKKKRSSICKEINDISEMFGDNQKHCDAKESFRRTLCSLDNDLFNTSHLSKLCVHHKNESMRYEL